MPDAERPEAEPRDRDHPARPHINGSTVGRRPGHDGVGRPALNGERPAAYTDIPEWVSEFRRLYVEPKTRSEKRDRVGWSRRPASPARPEVVSGGAGRRSTPSAGADAPGVDMAGADAPGVDMAGVDAPGVDADDSALDDGRYDDLAPGAATASASGLPSGAPTPSAADPSDATLPPSGSDLGIPGSALRSPSPSPATASAEGRDVDGPAGEGAPHPMRGSLHADAPWSAEQPATYPGPDDLGADPTTPEPSRETLGHEPDTDGGGPRVGAPTGGRRGGRHGGATSSRRTPRPARAARASAPRDETSERATRAGARRSARLAERRGRQRRLLAGVAVLLVVVVATMWWVTRGSRSASAGTLGSHSGALAPTTATAPASPGI
ncbi:hypothetical protein [Nostocoides sp. Soil756]|uniref:hypothetical protein n=1 Tax=Nostocoides sp. Soil756 TaxID=1736399 RepID=UPI0006F90414|nr:hypothetical protein [Tetrasphaera sp. Soil756]KRE61657.1 hypothetical protein ASG78_09945 [Tetrasphaera sp. Soil756]